jgi:hypothetical protein
MFCGHLECFVAIWYILWLFGIFFPVLVCYSNKYLAILNYDRLSHCCVSVPGVWAFRQWRGRRPSARRRRRTQPCTCRNHCPRPGTDVLILTMFFFARNGEKIGDFNSSGIFWAGKSILT